MVMDRLIRTITLHTFHTLNFACVYHMIPLPSIFTLWHPEVHISISNSGNISSNIEVSIDEALSLHSTLNVPNVYPDDGYV